MWFGDLVTMRWWNGIWLNEAFATFMSYRCVDEMRPDWRVWDSFARIRANAFEVDSLSTTRTIEYPVASPDDASGMFDTLTYTKGGAVLRMLEQWLGEDRFRDGIRRYLRTHAYANTETHDLWDALEEETGEPVRRVMDAWIFQAGYPAISVRRDGDVLRFAQHRFIPSQPGEPTTGRCRSSSGRSTPRANRWTACSSRPTGSSYPWQTRMRSWWSNAGGSSFVRVFYDDVLRERLVASALEVCSPVERQCLVDDAWAAVVAGDASASSFIDLVSGFSGEDDPGVWGAIITGLGWCDRFLDGAPRERFRDLVRDLVRPELERLGWEDRPGESDLDRELRGDLVRALGILGDDPETQAQAREAEVEARNGGKVPPAVAAAAVDVVAANGGPDEYEAFRGRVKAAATPQEQERYLYALTRFRDPSLMERTLASTLTDDVRPQDAPFLLARATTHRELSSQGWAFIEAHWDAIGERIASSNVIALAAGVRYITDPETVDAVQAFFADHDIPQNRLMLQQMLERQRDYAALRVAGRARARGPLLGLSRAAQPVGARVEGSAFAPQIDEPDPLVLLRNVGARRGAPRPPRPPPARPPASRRPTGPGGRASISSSATATTRST